MRREVKTSLSIFLFLLLVACGGGAATREEGANQAAGGHPTPTREAAITVTSPPATPTSSPVPAPGTGGLRWWNDTVWYEIFVRSFYDSDGDGIGDLQGVIQKLDYLNDGDPATTDDLGITGIWLMPIMESPSYHGYDVVDYYAVDDEYGSEEDFKELMAEAHERGIRVIVDLVLNHTSAEHPWFKAARAGDPEFEPWYRFLEGEPPRQRAPWGGGTIWHPAGKDRYYYGLYWSGMPDLNYRHPPVTEEMYRVTRFWVEEMGVDGFRLDGIAHLIEQDRQIKNSPETHEWLRAFHQFFKELKPDGVLVGEVWYPTNEIAPYIGEELDLAFEFNTATAILRATTMERAGAIEIAYKLDQRLYPSLQYAPFITNHDQDRAFSQLDGNVKKMRTAAAILLTGPGSPFLYYGEEVAMQGRKPDEDIRRPMPWSSGPTGGFTDAPHPWRAPAEGYETNNVEAMSREPDSLLNYYRRLIHLRNDHEALRAGDYLPVQSSDDRLFAFIRQSESERLLVIHNLSKDPIDEYQLSLQEGAGAAVSAASLLLGTGEPQLPQLNGAGGFERYTPLPTLEPYHSYIIRLGR